MILWIQKCPEISEMPLLFSFVPYKCFLVTSPFIIVKGFHTIGWGSQTEVQNSSPTHEFKVLNVSHDVKANIFNIVNLIYQQS